ncbi:MAG: hypothetical protein CMJ84_11375 [Planctomycetes bacterium]|nr:hypothetical protein [Planctomycetota bacterium]
MDAQAFRDGLGKLFWQMDFDAFCREILAVEPRQRDVWQEETWEAWKNLANAIGRFDNDNLQRILDKAIS